MSTDGIGDGLDLSGLLRRAVVEPTGRTVGRVRDVVVRLRGQDYPPIAGLVTDLGGRPVFLPIEQVSSWADAHVAVRTAHLDVRGFERRPGEVLLRADVLGHRLVDIRHARLVRAYDVHLAPRGGELVVAGLRTTRSAHRRSGDASFHDWRSFEALIGHEPTVLVRSTFGRLRSLRAAELADILQDASDREQAEILAVVHQDPELEADVYEELDEQRGTLLAARPDSEIADVLSRMRTDDAADALMDLPQPRRATVIAQLPPHLRAALTDLLSYNQATAGGLMGLEYLAIPEQVTAGEALAIARAARNATLETSVTLHLLDGAGRLTGTVPLLRIVQADPTTPLLELADHDPVRVTPDTDLADLAVLMADHNLPTLPVVGPDGHLLGVVTIDDVLPATIPAAWRLRDPDTRPEAEPRPLTSRPS